MIDQDRGAYAPQSDAPLRFDNRRAPSRPMPLALVGSAAVLLALVVSLVLFYRSGARPEGEPKQVGQPLASLKTPAPPAPKPAADASSTVYAPAKPAPATPKFEPPPEQPMSRAEIAAKSPPAPPAEAPRGLIVRQAPGPAVKIAPSGTSPTEAAPHKAPETAVARGLNGPPAATPAVEKPAPAAAGKTVAQGGSASDLRDRLAAKPMTLAAANAGPSKPAKAEKAQPAYAPDTAAQVKAQAKPAAKPVAAAPAVAGGAAVVQIGAYTSQDLAAKGFTEVAAKMGGAMAGHGKHFEPVDVGGSTRYRAQVTGFATPAEASRFCAALKAKGHDCIVKR